jgi:Ca2+-binding RTX toxin-like protein
MAGGAGDDTYFVESAGDLVGEAAGEGNDWVYTSLDYSWIAANVENLALEGAARHAYGNALGNWMLGSGSADDLQGLDGNDVLFGYAGADTLVGGAGIDTLYGNDDGDVLYGGADGDRLEGGAGADRLYGEAGNDTAGFSGSRSDYAIVYDAAAQAFTVSDQRTGAPDGVDVLAGIERFDFSDGRAEITVDVWGAEWTWYADYYDAAGVQTSRRGVLDDGGAWTTTYDGYNAQPWAYYVEFFNASGVRTGGYGVNDDGSTFGM